MSKFAVAALAAAFVLAGTAAESQAKNRTARNIAIGVGAAIATGIILSEAARARGRDYYSSDDHYRRCRSLLRKCDDGRNWACRKFNDEC
mgnify:CR=1 FL=1